MAAGIFLAAISNLCLRLAVVSEGEDTHDSGFWLGLNANSVTGAARSAISGQRSPTPPGQQESGGGVDERIERWSKESWLPRIPGTDAGVVLAAVADVLQ